MPDSSLLRPLRRQVEIEPDGRQAEEQRDRHGCREGYGTLPLPRTQRGVGGRSGDRGGRVDILPQYHRGLAAEHVPHGAAHDARDRAHENGDELRDSASSPARTPSTAKTASPKASATSSAPWGGLRNRV